MDVPIVSHRVPTRNTIEGDSVLVSAVPSQSEKFTYTTQIEAARHSYTGPLLIPEFSFF